LLTDIKEIFESKNIDKIFSSDLIDELCKDKEKPWSTFRHGSPIDQRILANLLKEFSITSRTVRIGPQVLKGYEFEQFTDSFSRYIPIIPIPAVTTLQVAGTTDQSHVSLLLQNIINNLSDTWKLANIKDCNAVTLKYSENDQIDEYLLEERAAIMEFDGGLSREEAERVVWKEGVIREKMFDSYI
jgi:hypothetical protein